MGRGEGVRHACHVELAETDRGIHVHTLYSLNFWRGGGLQIGPTHDRVKLQCRNFGLHMLVHTDKWHCSLVVEWLLKAIRIQVLCSCLRFHTLSGPTAPALTFCWQVICVLSLSCTGLMMGWRRLSWESRLTEAMTGSVLGHRSLRRLSGKHYSDKQSETGIKFQTRARITEHCPGENCFVQLVFKTMLAVSLDTFPAADLMLTLAVLPKDGYVIRPANSRAKPSLCQQTRHSP